MVGIIENLVVMITTIIMRYTHVSIAMCTHQKDASKLTNHWSGIYQQASDVTIYHGYGSTNKKTFGLFTSTQGDFDAAAANEPDLFPGRRVAGLPGPWWGTKPTIPWEKCRAM